MSTVEALLEYGEIPLDKGAVAIVDATDYESLRRHNWTLGAQGYAVRRDGSSTFYMHRELLGLSDTPATVSVTRLNGNKLDNRRQNLRVRTGAHHLSGIQGVPVEFRLIENIELTVRGCWFWTGNTDKNGYGRISIGAKARRAHRVAYEALVGPVPPGRQLDHLCRVPSCINPDHLEPVSPRENVMRGLTPAAANASKTHCPKGHPYDEENTYRRSDGSRGCRECNRAACRAYGARKRAKGAL
jgi:hypothetical protein